MRRRTFQNIYGSYWGGGNQCFPASIQQKFMKADWDQSAGSAVSHHEIIQLTPIRPRDREVRDERAGSGH